MRRSRGRRKRRRRSRRPPSDGEIATDLRILRLRLRRDPLHSVERRRKFESATGRERPLGSQEGHHLEGGATSFTREGYARGRLRAPSPVVFSCPSVGAVSEPVPSFGPRLRGACPPRRATGRTGSRASWMRPGGTSATSPPAPALRGLARERARSRSARERGASLRAGRRRRGADDRPAASAATPSTPPPPSSSARACATSRPTRAPASSSSPAPAARPSAPAPT